MASINVASVDATVVPDARGFKEKLDAQLRNLQATIDLRLLDEQVQAELDRVTHDRTVTINANLDSKAAAAQLDLLTRPRHVRADVDTSSLALAGQRIGLLTTSIIALGPALIPVAAGAAAAGGALVGMGAAGILAFKGIQAEIKAGTTEGQIFSQGLTTLKSDLGQLEATAAANILGPFVDGVSSIHSLMPDLNRDIGMFAGQLGRIASNILQGVIAGFHTLSPLMVQVGNGIADAAQGFERFASGDGLQRFGDYAAWVLPQVAAALGSIARAAIHIVEAFAPIGSTVLSALKGLADVINSIPTGTLSTLATGLVSVVLGLKGMQIAASVAAGVSRLSVALGGAALSATAMGLASAGIGAALGVATFLWAKHEAAVQANKQEIQSYTDALIESNGAINENIRSMEAKDLLDKVNSSTLSQLHLSLADVTAAALGQAGAMDKVQANAKKYGSELVVTNRAQLETGQSTKRLSSSTNELLGVVGQAASNLRRAQQNQRAYAQAMADTEVVTGRTASSTLAAQAAKKLEAAATKRQTAATNALNQALDAEISKQATLAGGALAVDQAMLTLTKSLKKNKGAMSSHTQAGIDDRQAILGAVQALQSQRDTLIKTGTATDDATRKYGRQAQQLLDNIKKQDGASSSAYKYAQKLLAIPKDVKTAISTPGSERSSAQARNVHREIDAIPSSHSTNINVNAGGALLMVRQVNAAINALHDRSVTITTYQRNIYSKQQGMAGVFPGRAAGGLLRGPGTSTSDSIPIMGSDGEYMIKAAAVQKYGVAFFDQLNAMRLAQGGPVTSRPAAIATSPVGGVPLVSVGTIVTNDDQAAARALETRWRDAMALYNVGV